MKNMLKRIFTHNYVMLFHGKFLQHIVIRLLPVTNSFMWMIICWNSFLLAFILLRMLLTFHFMTQFISMLDSFFVCRLQLMICFIHSFKSAVLCPPSLFNALMIINPSVTYIISEIHVYYLQVWFYITRITVI